MAASARVSVPGLLSAGSRVLKFGGVLPAPVWLLWVLVLSLRCPLATHFSGCPSDLNQVWYHIQIIRGGGRLYWPWVVGPDILVNRGRFPVGRLPYPPFLTPALTPLAGVGLPVFGVVWYVLLVAAVLAYAAALAKLATGRVRPFAVLGALAWLIPWPGTYHALHEGNVEPILWAVTGWALALPAARGAGFSVVALVKLWGVWPVAFAATQRRAVLRGAVVTFAAAVLVSTAVLGPTRFVASCLDWFRYALPAVSQGYLNEGNVSLSFAVVRFAMNHGWHYAGGPLPLVAWLWLTGAAVVAPLAAGLLFRRSDERLQLATVVAASVLFAPVCWLYYLPVLLAPLAAWVGEYRLSRSVKAESNSEYRPNPVATT